MKKKIMTSILSFIFGLAVLSQALGEDAASIITQLDKIMNPDCLSTYTLEFWVKGELSEKYQMNIKSKDNNQKVIVRFLSPAKQVGNDLIMLDKSVWAYDARSGRTVKVPANQSFGDTGFSYGDIVRLNLSDNYKAKIEKEDEQTWTLKLTALRRDVPYMSIDLVVDKQGKYPVAATFYAKNNKVIKSIQYTDPQTLNGKEKPTTLTVISPYDADTVSIMKLESETLKEYPDNIFNKRILETRLDESL